MFVVFELYGVKDRPVLAPKTLLRKGDPKFLIYT